MSSTVGGRVDRGLSGYILVMSPCITFRSLDTLPTVNEVSWGQDALGGIDID